MFHKKNVTKEKETKRSNLNFAWGSPKLRNSLAFVQFVGQALHDSPRFYLKHL